MNGFCGLIGPTKNSIKDFEFVKSINLAETMQTSSLSDENFFLAVSTLDSTPLKGERIFKSGDFIYLFAGDLIDQYEIPWIEIEENFVKSNFGWISNLRGIFAFVIFNKKHKTIHLISDHMGQFPVYYSIIDDSLVFSSSIPTFTLLDSKPEFNLEWLYEYLFLNLPINDTTFLKNVKRLGPSSVLEFNQTKKNTTISNYGKLLNNSDQFLTGKKALDKGIKMFKEIVPKYYCHERKNLVALSGGFDSRTLLTLAPKKSFVECYTYGIKNSGDLNVVSQLNDKLKLNHREILFDERFEKKLPSLIYDTVRLSGGTQPIIRSTLIYVYKSISKNNDDKKTPIVIGGINGDIFRGANGEPGTAVTVGLDHFFRTGEVEIDNNFYKKIFNNLFDDFEDHIHKTFKKIKEIHGHPFDPSTFMSYCIYEINPKYFGGEMAIASNYLTMRLPYMDLDLLKYAYNTEFSNLSLSPYLYNKKANSLKKYKLQSAVIFANPEFKKTYINGMPISLFARNNKLLFQISRLFIRGFAYLRFGKNKEAPLEGWENWFKNILNKEMDKLLNDNSIILKYIKKEAITDAKKTDDIQLLNKLATTEIILNLIKNKWNI